MQKLYLNEWAGKIRMESRQGFWAEVAAYWTVHYRLRPRKTTHTPTQYNRGLIQCTNKGKGKGRVVPVHAMKVFKSSSIAPPILNLDTRRRWPVANPDLEIKPSEKEQRRSVYPSARPDRLIRTTTGSQRSTSCFGRFSPVPTEHQGGWTPQPVWTFWRE